MMLPEAANSPQASIITRSGRTEPADPLIRRLYIRSLGLVHLIAFCSLWSQIHGLVGEQGLLPVGSYFRLAQEKLGPSACLQLPTLCWFGSSDLMLHVWCGLGTALSLVLILGVAPRLTLILLWAIYLSLTIAGQTFLSFQWDSLLLEMTACSILYAPPGWRPHGAKRQPTQPIVSTPTARAARTSARVHGARSQPTCPIVSTPIARAARTSARAHGARSQPTCPIVSTPIARAARTPLPIAKWLLWLLAFKLMVLSGVTKLLSGDTAWSDGSALHFHYYTQPIPNWVSWYAWQLPPMGHRVALLALFAVEVVLPFLVFAGRRGRAIFGVATIILMIAIQLTGNFGFFNLQTIVLSLPLLNDGLLRRGIPGRWLGPEPALPPPTSRPQWVRVLGNTAASLVLLASLLVFFREMIRTAPPDKMPHVVTFSLKLANRSLLSWGENWVLKPIGPYRTINGYGLFRVMTTRRPEIVVETSHDGVSWDALEFPYKPGQLDRAPPIVAPHMPRLDWQMWFAALNPRGSEYWLSALAQRILDGNPQVARLLGHPELAQDPPRYVRLAVFDYKFSTMQQRRATGAWWSRSQSGYLTGAISRRTE